MIEFILLEISMALMSLYLIFKLRHGLHIFQLESYKPERYNTWMKKNKDDLINIRELLLIVPLIILPFNLRISLIIQNVVLILMWLSRNIYHERKTLG